MLRSHDERGAVVLPMTGIVAMLFGLSALLATQLGVTGRDASSLAQAAADTGAAALSPTLPGLDPTEARSRAGRLDAGPACRAARAAAAPDALVSACSIVGTDFVVVVLTTESPMTSARATVSLIEGSTT